MGKNIRSKRWCMAALGTVMCLLAALFAVEAKVAWYSPAGSARAQISYAKLRAAEPAKLMVHGQSQTVPGHLPVVSVLAACALLCAAVTGLHDSAPRPLKLSKSPAFSASHFFRPPPRV